MKTTVEEKKSAEEKKSVKEKKSAEEKKSAKEKKSVKEKKTAREWKEFYLRPEFAQRYTYRGNDLGVICTREGTAFRLWSPCAEQITLRLYRDGSRGGAYRTIPMVQREKGVWEYRTAEYLHEIYYDYELVIEGESRCSADPYAKACGVNGLRSMAVDLAETNPSGWEEDRAPLPEPERFIYELHVKEFSWDKSGGFPEEYRGKYKAFLIDDTTLNGEGVYPTGIPYLKRLGVTHVQLMPCYDYGSVDEAGAADEFNWGYDPLNYNVPEGSYATDAEHGSVRIREMKEMIQSLHRSGFRVIMDVVYNHTYSLDSWLQRTVPWYYYRAAADGTVSNGSACGNDVASERAMCGKYILDSVLYWTEEYHIDGFRFDLMGLLDVELMNCIREALDVRYGKGEKLVFGEPWSADQTEMEGESVPALKENIALLDENVGIFCDNTRDAVKGAVFELKEPGFVNGGKGCEEAILNSVKAWCHTEEGGLSAKAPSQIITYVSSHDNQTLWDKLTDTVADEELRMRVNRLTAALYMTCQGTIFFLSGEEFARTKGGHDNTFNLPVSLNRLDWTMIRKNEKLVEYYQGLIALRRQLPGLCDKSAQAWKRIRDMWKTDGAIGFTVDNASETQTSGWAELLVVYNSRKETLRRTLPEGEWQILADADSSRKWQEDQYLRGTVEVSPVSALILGRKQQRE